MRVRCCFMLEPLAMNMVLVNAHLTQKMTDRLPSLTTIQSIITAKVTKIEVNISFIQFFFVLRCFKSHDLNLEFILNFKFLND